MVGRTNVGGGGGASWDNAVIHIYAPAGSVITASKGGVTKPVKEHIVIGQASEYFHYIKPADFGEWTIHATQSAFGETSESVSATENVEYIVRFNSHVPWIYQEVEYLQSNGNQKIELDYVTKLNSVITCDWMFTDISSSLSRMPAIYGNGDYGCDIRYNSWISKIALIFGGAANQSLSGSINNTHRTVMDRYKTIFDGSEYTYDVTPSISSTRKMWLFGNNHDSQASEMRSKSRIYYFNVKENNASVINCYPCYLKGNPSTCGMFDLANNKLYQNVGTGTFTVGGDV